MIFKSKHIGLLDSSMERQLYIEYNSSYPVSEPYDEEIEPEEPRLLRRSVDLLAGGGLLTEDALSEKLGISPAEISQLASIDWTEGRSKPRPRPRNGLSPAPESNEEQTQRPRIGAFRSGALPSEGGESEATAPHRPST